MFAANAFADDNISIFDNWTISGPNGGDVRAVAIDPKDKNHLFVTTLDGQVYDSIDSGNSWRLLVNLTAPQLILDNIVVDSRDSMTLYVSGHRHKQPGGFFKSTDGGRTWRESPELHNEAVHALAQSENDPNFLVAGTFSGVWYSRDSGDTWQRSTSGTTPKTLDALAIDPRDENTIYAGTWYRPYKTTDGGKSWRLIKQGMIDDSDVFAIDINPANPDKVIASACSGIYISNDQGESWTKAKGIPSQSRRTRAIVQNPGNADFVYAGTTEGFWMSSNGGTSWALTTTKKLEINSIAVHPDMPNRVYIGTNNNGLMVSNDFGRTFEENNGNFSSRFAFNITPDIAMKNRFYATTINTATGGGYVFVSNDYGKTWTDSSGNLDVRSTMAYSIIQDEVNPLVLYLGTNSGIFKSTNRGATWAEIKAPRPTPTRRRSRKSKAAPVATLPAGTIAAIDSKVNVMVHTKDGKNGILAGTDKGLYRSYDIAKGWQKVNLPAGAKDQITAIHVAENNANLIYAGTAISGVFVSADDGENWHKLNTIPEGIPISSIVTDPNDPSVIFVGTVQTMYKSKDSGKTWVRKGGGLPLGNYTSILVNPNDSSDMFAASALESNGGLYHSSDAGETWTRIDKSVDLASRRIWSLMFNPVNPNEILAGTQSAGIYRINRTIERTNENEVEPKTGAQPQTVRARITTSN
ncbi:MAG: VPS10 domain-containing protein [Pyrinomonadaceae bacterium]